MKILLSSFLFRLHSSPRQCPHTHIYSLELFNFRIKQVFHKIHSLAIITDIASKGVCGGGRRWHPEDMGPQKEFIPM